MAIGLFLVFGTVAAKQLAAKRANAEEADEDDDQDDRPSKQSVDFPRPKPVSAETRHYRFSYLSTQTRAGRLIDRSDPVFETVQMYFRTTPGDRIAADLTGSSTNTAGTAFWNTVRMDLQGSKSGDDLAAVLGHETTHVFVQRLARANETKVFRRLWPLDEGLATYVEYRFFRPPSELELEDRLLATLRIRRQLEAEELIFSDRLLRNRGREMAYPMGRLFVEALVRRYGETAPARIFLSSGERDLPDNLGDFELWTELFRANGYDLGLVVDDFYGAADRLARKHRTWVEQMPRPRGAVEVKGKWIRLRTSLDGNLPGGWSVVCRIRPSADATYDRYRSVYGSEGTFGWARSEVSGQRAWYQLGLSDGSGPVLYEPWASAPLD
jgi:hypothetical protein